MLADMTNVHQLAAAGDGYGAHVRAREGAAWGGGAPRATEPGCGAAPHVRMDGA